MITTTHIIETGGREIEVEVDAHVTPYRRATFHHPAEGGEVEIYQVRVDGEIVTGPIRDELIDALDGEIEEAIGDEVDDARQEAAFDRAMHRAQVLNIRDF